MGTANIEKTKPQHQSQEETLYSVFNLIYSCLACCSYVCVQGKITTIRLTVLVQSAYCSLCSKPCFVQQRFTNGRILMNSMVDISCNQHINLQVSLIHKMFNEIAFPNFRNNSGKGINVSRSFSWNKSLNRWLFLSWILIMSSLCN